jgi:hypothetical protein
MLDTRVNLRSEISEQTPRFVLYKWDYKESFNVVMAILQCLQVRVF